MKPLAWLVTIACMATACARENPEFERTIPGMDTAVPDDVDLRPAPPPADALATDALVCPMADSGTAPDAAGGPEPGILADAAPERDAARPMDTADSAPAYPPPVASLAVGLVGRYRLDPTGNRVVPDDSGTRSGMTFGSASWSSSGFPAALFKNEGALSLDDGGYATLSTAGLPALGGDKSLALWFWQPDAMNSPRRILVTLTNRPAALGIHLGLQAGVASLWVWKQALGQALVAHSAVSPGGWTHLAYTYQAGTHRLYVGGVQVHTSMISYGGTTSIGEVMLGAWSTTATTERWIGKIDDLRIYDRVLTADEVSALAAGRQ